MTPYKDNGKQTVVVTPDIHDSKFHFGPIPEGLKDLMGTIIKRKYVWAMKTYTYEVRFEGITQTFWFKECEILP